MLLLRIKQIEFALRGGRLEDAYKRLQDTDVREHRRGQELTQQLVAALVQRGQHHLGKHQLDAAAIDCQRAADLAGQQEAVIDLRRQIETESRQDAEQRRRKNGIADQIRSMIRRGDFVGSKEKLDDLSHGPTRGALDQEIDRKQTRVDAAIQKVESALANSDDDRALAGLLELQRLQPDHAKFSQLRSQFVTAVSKQLDLSVADGRLDQATRLLSRIRPLGIQCDRVADVESIVARLQQAATALDRGDQTEVHRLLKQTAQLSSKKMSWLKSAVAEASIAAEAVESLRTGPLSLLFTGQSFQDTSPFEVSSLDMETNGQTKKQSPLISESSAGAFAVPERFLIQADGVGSYLVVRNDRTRLGPASSSRSPDVELQGMNNKTNVRIDRLDEDYFLRSDHEVKVNQQAKSEALLANGDVISLGKRCRAKFRLPSATTSTAMLEFSGTSFPRRDVRGVVLLNDAIILGPGSGTHIRLGAAAKPTVLFLRGESLFCRGRDESIPISFGEPFVIGETSLVCTEV